MWWFGRNKVVELINSEMEVMMHRVITNAVHDTQADLTKIRDMSTHVQRLQEQISKLELDRDKKREEFDRREREIQHSLGLHKLQIAKEIDWARKDANIEASTKALEGERKLFEKQMKFHQDRFEKEVTYQRGLLEKMMKALPSAEIFLDATKEPTLRRKGK